jgi:hypothetical protein
MRLLAAFVTVLLILTTQSTAFGANNLDVPCRWPDPGYRPFWISHWWGPNLVGSPDYDWRIKFNLSQSDWNNTGGPIGWFESSASANKFDSYWASDGLYGMYSTSCSGGLAFSTTALANSAYGSSYNWNANFMRSVTGHESGHGLGLGHSTVTPAIMNTSRDRYTIYTPQTDDVNGLWQRYPSP